MSKLPPELHGLRHTFPETVSPQKKLTSHLVTRDSLIFFPEDSVESFDGLEPLTLKLDEHSFMWPDPSWRISFVEGRR